MKADYLYMSTRERHEYICECYKNGESIGDISKRIGLSYNWILQLLSLQGVELRNEKPKCIFPNLEKWRKENKVSHEQLCKIMGRGNIPNNYYKLCGIGELSLTDIQRLLDYTGYTFEYLFEEEKS